MFSADSARDGESTDRLVALILGAMRIATIVVFLVGCGGATESDPTPPPLPEPACVAPSGTYATTWKERPGGTCGERWAPKKFETGWETDPGCTGALTPSADRCVESGVVTCDRVKIDWSCRYSADATAVTCVVTMTDGCVSTYDVTGSRVTAP